MLLSAIERVTVTGSNCAEVLGAIAARDQRREVRIGDVLTHYHDARRDGEKAEVTIWHNRRRAAVCCDDGDSQWGDWDEWRQTVALDEPGGGGNRVTLNRHGEQFDEGSTSADLQRIT